jgi:HEAT repeats
MAIDSPKENFIVAENIINSPVGAMGGDMSTVGETTQLLAVGTEDPVGSPTLLVAGGPSGPMVGGMLGVGAQTSFVTHNLFLSTTPKPRMVGVWLGLLLVLGGLGVYGLYRFGEIEDIMAMLGLTSQPEVAYVKKVKLPVSTATTVKVAPSAPKAPTPIWALVANEPGAGEITVGPPLTSDQQAQVGEALKSPFTYQRYKAVMDLAATHPAGSISLLREALESNKLWTRMRALIALADLGDEINQQDVEMALGDAHSELRSRFFKRFEKSLCTMGCFYVARASLPYLDAEGRAEVVRVISREPSKVRDLYMVAATFDESDEVKQTAVAWLDRHNVDPNIWRDLNRRIRQ